MVNHESWNKREGIVVQCKGKVTETEDKGSPHRTTEGLRSSVGQKHDRGVHVHLQLHTNDSLEQHG